MARSATMALVTLALAACGADDDRNNEADVTASDTTPSDAYIEFRGRHYDMTVRGKCGTEPDGTYLTWAVTPDSSGNLIPDAPHMYAMRRANWSVIDVYWPDDDSIVRIYREGRDRFGFENGVLTFEGELGAGLTETAKVQIVCPGKEDAQP